MIQLKIVHLGESHLGMNKKCSFKCMEAVVNNVSFVDLYNVA